MVCRAGAYLILVRVQCRTGVAMAAKPLATAASRMIRGRDRMLGMAFLLLWRNLHPSA
jgi:hypothetical protein